MKLIVQENEEKYKQKAEAIKAAMEAEHAKYLADLAKQFNEMQDKAEAATSHLNTTDDDQVAPVDTAATAATDSETEAAGVYEAFVEMKDPK